MEVLHLGARLSVYAPKVLQWLLPAMAGKDSNRDCQCWNAKVSCHGGNCLCCTKVWCQYRSLFRRWHGNWRAGNLTSVCTTEEDVHCIKASHRTFSSGGGEELNLGLCVHEGYGSYPLHYSRAVIRCYQSNQMLSELTQWVLAETCWEAENSSARVCATANITHRNVTVSGQSCTERVKSEHWKNKAQRVCPQRESLFVSQLTERIQSHRLLRCSFFWTLRTVYCLSQTKWCFIYSIHFDLSYFHIICDK